jgi:hypothetical protein
MVNRESLNGKVSLAVAQGGRSVPGHVGAMVKEGEINTLKSL